jgi:hypothetical protein
LGRAQAKLPNQRKFANLLRSYAQGAKVRGFIFCLNFDEFKELVTTPCHYCGNLPEGDRFNGIDRIDSSLGYVPENSVPCCRICNRAKSNSPVGEFESWLHRVGCDYRPQGWLSLSSVVDASGADVPVMEALRRGWLKTDYVNPVFKSYDDLKDQRNLFLDQGRQLVAYCVGFRAPIENYTLQKFSVGTGVTPARVTDVALEAPIALASAFGATAAPITSVDFLTAFVMRIGFTVSVSDANGYLITEFGLLSGNNTLLARKVRGVGINKTSDFAPTLTWRIRF